MSRKDTNEKLKKISCPKFIEQLILYINYISSYFSQSSERKDGTGNPAQL